MGLDIHARRLRHSQGGAVMKICRHCQSEYVPLEWQVRKGDYECHPCRKRRQAKWRLERKTAGRPVVSGKMPAEYHRSYAKQYFSDPSNRQRVAARMRRYRSDESLRPKYDARQMVRSAVRRGEIKRQPCEQCGAEKAEAHHDDYSQPLNVRWLCPTHHRLHHREAKATGATS